MNIVHVMNYYQPNMGYQENNLPFYQNKLGHNITIITSDRYLPFKDYDKYFLPILGNRIIGEGTKFEDDVKIVRLPILFENIKSQKILFIKREFVKLIEKLSPDIIHIHNEQNLNLIYIRKLIRKNKVKVFVDCHSDYQNSRISKYKNNFLFVALKKFYNIYFSKYIVNYMPINEASREHLIKLYGINENIIKINRLGTSFKQNINIEDTFNFRTKYDIDEDDIIIIASGKFNLLNRSDLLLKGLNTILEKYNNVKVMLIGIVYSEINNFISKKFMLIPFQKYEALQIFYKNCDIAVFSTATTTIMDAMKYSKPIIIYDELNTNYYLDSNKNGIGYTTIEQLKFAIESLVTNSNLRYNMGNSSRKFIEEHLTWEKIAEETIIIYQEA